VTRAFSTIERLAEAVGSTLGVGEWVSVDQDRIDAFAAVTGDRQWIHIDPERAKEGPFGTTVAHGYLTLSLLPELVGEVYRVEGTRAAINYGLERVRFPTPLPSGSRVQASVELLAVTPRPEGARVQLRVTVHREGHAERPVLVAETITLLAFA
jgi:acyl dehydratase